jgi:hypothetical protein
MPPHAAGDPRELIEAVISAASILGGAMAYCSGFRAAQAKGEGRTPEGLANSVNEGVAEGFQWGLPLAAITLIIVAWS